MGESQSKVKREGEGEVMDVKEALTVGAIMAAIIGGILWLAFVANSMTCTAQWQESGMQARFQLFGGCMIQLPTGAWIPADAYREIP